MLFLCACGFFNQNLYHFSSNCFLNKMLNFYKNICQGQMELIEPQCPAWVVCRVRLEGLSPCPQSEA